MRSLHADRSLSQGVLLMEALVGLLLFVSMTTIISSYWHYLASIKGRTHDRLHGLSIARQAVQQLIMDHKQMASKKEYDITYEYMPVSLSTDMIEQAPLLSLVTIKVTSSHNNIVVLQTLYAEH